jgi:Tol biopolymer transport system component
VVLVEMRLRFVSKEQNKMDTRNFFSLGLAFFTMFLLGCDSSKNPINPIEPAEGQIVFTSHNGIYIINHDGTGLKKLADGFEICLSPDGENVLFTALSGKKLDIFAVGIDGSSQRNLTQTPVNDSQGQWSPDGFMIAYQSGPSCGSDNIWVMNADGSGQRQITKDTTAFSHWPRWSPDGARIAFMWSRKDSKGKFSGYDKIHTIRVDGSGEITIVSNGSYPEWCPDGSMLSFRRESLTYVINSDGSGLRPILPNEPSTYVGKATWSPDGKRIAFVQYIERVGNVFIANKDGSGKIKLTQFTSGGVDALSWSPDSKRIAFSQSGALYIMDADGSNLRQITEVMGISEACWVPESQ